MNAETKNFMMAKLCVIAISFFVETTLFAQEPQQVFAEANQLYLQQKYAEAIRRYEAIIKTGYESGEVYFNLGNAYYKTGKIQNAILNYERAHTLLPTDEDIRFNLQLVNLQVIDKIEALPQLFLYRWIENMMTTVSTRTLGWLSYFFFLFVLAVLSLFLFARTLAAKRRALLAAMFGGVIAVVFFTGYISQSYKEAHTSYAIVMGDVVNIKSAPDSGGSDAFILHRGVKVQVLDYVNAWRKIRLPDGKVGWISEKEVETI